MTDARERLKEALLPIDGHGAEFFPKLSPMQVACNNLVIAARAVLAEPQPVAAWQPRSKVPKEPGKYLVTFGENISFGYWLGDRWNFGSTPEAWAGPLTLPEVWP